MNAKVMSTMVIIVAMAAIAALALLLSIHNRNLEQSGRDLASEIASLNSRAVWYLLVWSFSVALLITLKSLFGMDLL